MLHEIIHLNKEYNLNTDAYIEIMVPYNNDQTLKEKGKAIVIVPGGAYEFVSVREADPVAISYMQEGFVTIVLHYTVKTPYPTPMYELGCAMDYLRKNCDKYYIDKDKISIIGFSAGGHLVSSYSYLYKHPDFIAKTNLNPENIKPNCLVSSYPVITMGEYTHEITRSWITGNNEELRPLLSVENNIDSTYPPTFVWTTVEDTIVPYINSILFVEALRENNVEHDFFLYPFLDHGLSVITPLLHSEEVLKNPKMQEVSRWFDKSVNFINKVLK
jgi:acetyl esterase/lipase